MELYKINNKDLLTWIEMPQIDYQWKLPILVDKDMNVLLGNSIKDKLSDTFFIIVIDNNARLSEDLIEIERKLAEENSPRRIGYLDNELRNYFRELKKPVCEPIELFDFVETGCVTKENFILPPPYDFNKNHKKGMIDLQTYLFETEDNKKSKKIDDDIQVDLEILKELL